MASNVRLGGPFFVLNFAPKSLPRSANTTWKAHKLEHPGILPRQIDVGKVPPSCQPNQGIGPAEPPTAAGKAVIYHPGQRGCGWQVTFFRSYPKYTSSAVARKPAERHPGFPCKSQPDRQLREAACMQSTGAPGPLQFESPRPPSRQGFLVRRIVCGSSSAPPIKSIC